MEATCTNIAEQNREFFYKVISTHMGSESFIKAVLNSVDRPNQYDIHEVGHPGHILIDSTAVKKADAREYFSHAVNTGICAKATTELKRSISEKTNAEASFMKGAFRFNLKITKYKHTEGNLWIGEKDLPSLPNLDRLHRFVELEIIPVR